VAPSCSPTSSAWRLQQAATQGELQHALAAGLMKKDDVWAELGDILIGRRPGRTDDLEVTVVDLTGVGVLDAAVAELALRVAGLEEVLHAKHH
jgi:ornithine cyclodeaminase/alanine dehydrogenase-like protein (mu-crystallin family)